MILEYSDIKQIFVQNEYNRISGGDLSNAQIFYSNRWIEKEVGETSLFAYDTPMYTTIGGTLNYYGQDINSIFTNTYRPSIRFNFSANTDSFGTGTTIVHNIYKIDFKTFQKSSSNLQLNDASKENLSIKEITENNQKNKFDKTTATLTENNVNINDFYDNAYSNVETLLETPILTITASTTGITSNIYDLALDECYKNLGSYKFQLFEDRSQYFITTIFMFERTQGEDYVDFYKYSDESGLYEYDFQKTFVEETSIVNYTITAGTFSGLSVAGNFFSYFLIPNKPKLQEPLVSGQLDTFTPTFRFSDVDDGNKYLLQVVYSSGDSMSFSGTVYSYPLSKEDSALDTREMLGLESGDWGIDYEVKDVFRKLSAPLKPNKNFWYRIGNIKTINNLFGVDQSVVTFSDILSATTGSDLLSTFVQVESDSPYVETVPIYETPTYIDDTEEPTYTLSGIVSGSIVTGATVYLYYPSDVYISQTTTETGYYEFNEIDEGEYTLVTNYRGYKQDSRDVSITGNTSLSFKIKLVWGNNIDTWNKLANENYFI